MANHITNGIDVFPAAGRYARHVDALQAVVELLTDHVNGFIILVPEQGLDRVLEDRMREHLAALQGCLADYYTRATTLTTTLTDEVYRENVIENAGYSDFMPLDELAALTRFAVASRNARYRMSDDQAKERAKALARGEAFRENASQN